MEQKVVIKYDPYRNKTEITIDETNIATGNTYGYYEKLKGFLDSGIPLQTWIEPIPGTEWNGILSELKADVSSDTIVFDFYGREIDFRDFKNICKSQNKQRKFKLKLSFNFYKTLTDKNTLKIIESVKNRLYSDEIKSIMSGYASDSELQLQYQSIEQEYNIAKNNEFRIVFAGLFSSGKSLIINTLIRHDILPIAELTCTAKICRISHDSKLAPNESILECFTKDDECVIPQECYASDEDCRKRITELSATAEDNTTTFKFDYFAIKVNLSHLYPSAEIADEFVLTIIDTPGTNSAKTRGALEGVDDENNNLHRQITLDAITNQSKDIVVLCFQNDQFESESLGDLITTIYNTSEKDRNSFCDRFLFVANKCDQNQYSDDGNDSIGKRKENIIATLSDAKKLGIKEQEVCFVPKVFMTAAQVEYAIQLHAPEIGVPNSGSRKMRQLIKAYNNYSENLLDEYTQSDYMLARHSGNPSYIKDEFEKQYEQLLAEGKIPEAISIQTGIPCIERAIKDYLKRYAIPFKAISLLHTFDYFLDAIHSQLEEKDKLIVALELKQGEHEQQGKGAKEKQEAAKKRNHEREIVKKGIASAKTRVDAITFKNELIKISNRLEEEFELKPAIIDIRTASSTNQAFTKDEIEAKMATVERIFTGFCAEAEYRFSGFSSYYQGEIQKILEELKAIGQSIETGDAATKCSATLNSIKGWNVDSLREDVNQTKARKVFTKPNPVKAEKYNWWQFGRRLKQWLAKPTIDEVREVYTTTPINIYLNEKLYELRKFFATAEKDYIEDLTLIKKTVSSKLEAIEREIDQGEQDIITFSEELEQIRHEKEALEEKIATIRKQKSFLDDLIESCNFGG